MGFQVSVFGLRFKSSQGQSLHRDLYLDSVENVFGLRFPILWLDRVCFLKFSQGQSLHHDLGLDSVENVFGLRFPVLWLDRVCLLKSSRGQSLHHDLCFDSVENGISSFHLRFLISRSLAWSSVCFEVLSRSKHPSWSLLRFSLRFLFLCFPVRWLDCVSVSWSPLRVRASLMIFA